MRSRTLLMRKRCETARSLACSILLSGLLLTGCATKKEPAAAAQPIPGTAPTQQVTKPKRSPLTYLWPPSWVEMIFPKKQGPPQAQAPQLVGTIKMVNVEDRFVLIDATSYQGMEPGTLLLTITDQKETANLRMSSLKNPPFLIADITSGTPAPGDRVFKP